MSSIKIVWFDGQHAQEKSFTEKYDALMYYNTIRKTTEGVSIYLKSRGNKWTELIADDLWENGQDDNRKLLID